MTRQFYLFTEKKTYITQRLINVHRSFIKTKKWKQPTCPSTSEWMNTMWHIHPMEYYLAIKKNKLPICYNMDEL